MSSNLQELFIGKTNGASFISDNPGLYEQLSTCLDGKFTFLVKILHTIPHTAFCFDLFKKHFRIKTNKDIHKKLIEVFSFRNDLPQRYYMVHGALQTLLAKHKFPVPQQLVEQQEQMIVGAIKEKPDYTVYRKQKNFKSLVTQLAEKQVREMLFADHLAVYENVSIADDDICSYLNLMMRPRTRQFIHFEPRPQSGKHDVTIPIASEELIPTCLREKTINHVIYHLTK